MTATELQAKWMARDRLYGERKTNGDPAVTAAEETGIVSWRRLEANSLRGPEKAKALVKLAAWTAPRGRRF